MKAKLIKAVALASLGAFLTVGIGANIAQAKDYRYTIGDSPRMKKNADGTVDSSDHPWFKKGEKKKKHRKHKSSKRDKHDKKKQTERSHQHMRSESSND
ncbi:hypothetical protein [uncultured Veillonella sp.]|uniref:hypothetical protein n=1 Tax=uncultured Veillonella sp. TaxID=159268 RepID=UPI002618DD3C|nr:hypothetical protein [uncultured Veillonella sp.]